MHLYIRLGVVANYCSSITLNGLKYLFISLFVAYIRLEQLVTYIIQQGSYVSGCSETIATTHDLASYWKVDKRLSRCGCMQQCTQLHIQYYNDMQLRSQVTKLSIYKFGHTYQTFPYKVSCLIFSVHKIILMKRLCKLYQLSSQSCVYFPQFVAMVSEQPSQYNQFSYTPSKPIQLATSNSILI